MKLLLTSLSLISASTADVADQLPDSGVQNIAFSEDWVHITPEYAELRISEPRRVLGLRDYTASACRGLNSCLYPAARRATLRAMHGAGYDEVAKSEEYPDTRSAGETRVFAPKTEAERAAFLYADVVPDSSSL